MGKSTIISAVRALPLDVPMTKAFGIAGGAQEEAKNVLVEIELTGGIRGWGEAAPFPAFNGETQEQVLVRCRSIAERLIGGDVDRFRKLMGKAREEMADDGRFLGSAVCALETAVLDAHCRAHDLSMVAHFGGTETSLSTAVTITTM